jgi:hypothetical protein
MATGKAFTIEVQGEALTLLAQRGKSTIRRAMELVADAFASNVKREAPVGQTGWLHNQWYAEAVGGMSLDQKVWTPLPYAAAVNYGTKPHAAPWSEIDAWAKFRGLPTFPIWYSILKKGTKANPYVDRAMDQTLQDVQQYLDRAMKEKGL